MKYAALMEQRIGPHLSEEEIHAIHNRTLLEIIGDDAPQRFKQVADQAIQPLESGFVQVHYFCIPDVNRS